MAYITAGSPAVLPTSMVREKTRLVIRGSFTPESGGLA